jgi:hypothetical protein
MFHYSNVLLTLKSEDDESPVSKPSSNFLWLGAALLPLSGGNQQESTDAAQES